jgi:TP901 family phage tail tape measure protein
MAKLQSQLVLNLTDNVSRPIRAVSAALNRLTAAQARNNARLAAVSSSMFAAGAVAYGLARAISAPVRAATDFETKLESIGQKIDAPVAALPKLGVAIRKVARDTTQSAADIADGMDVLTGMGASGDDAIAMLKPIGRAATAYNAEITDLSQASYAALQNLKVPAEQVGAALDVMAQSGKAGAFELKDMAKYAPSIFAAYQGLGQTGVKAVGDLSAAMQVVRMGAGDSAEAATNLGNILQKINAPQTRKAFANMGVNLQKEMAKAIKKGQTPIEAIAEITNRTLKGNLANLGDLFQDAQVQKGLRPLIQNIELYRKIRAEALAAQGVVQADYERRLQTGAVATKRWRIALGDLNLAIGNALLPALTSLANSLIPIINRMSDFADAHPALTRAIVATTAGLVGLRVAALAAQFSLLWMKGGLISAGIAGLRGLSGALGVAGRSFKAFRMAAAGATLMGAVGAGGMFTGIVAAAGSAVSGVLGIFAGLAAGIAAITAPVWGIIALVAAAVAGLALAVYNYWIPISQFVGGFVQVVSGALSDLVSTMAGFGARIASAVGSWAVDRLVDIGALLGIDEATVRGAVDNALAAISSMASSIVAAIKAIPAAVSGWISDIFTMNDYGAEARGEFRYAGMQAGQAMVDAIKASFDGLISWFTSLPARIVAAIGRIDLSGLIKWPSLPTWLGGSSPAVENAAAVTARAAGGPVRGGRPYLIGERGPELMVPNRNGFVVPNHALAGGGGGGQAAPAPSRSLTMGDINVTVYAQPQQSVSDLGNQLAGFVRNTVEGGFSDGAM